MNCAVPHERLCAWVHGEEDDPAVADELSSHVLTCERCRAVVAEMREIVDALRRPTLPLGAPAPTTPETIGGYRIIRRIGQGGMGVVYEAEQQHPRRLVALKVTHTSRAADEFHQRLFAREVQTLARLNHTGIAAIYDAGRTGQGEPYFAMELVQGVNLLEYVAGMALTPPRGHLTVRERLELFCEVSEAINYAHQRGVVHRDLKPGNILVTPDGRPKVLDFGLARLLESEVEGGPRLTEAGRMVGTLEYMSPEQARGDVEAIDIRSDVYSLGVILYELLTAALPHDVDRRAPLHETVRMICETPPTRPESFVPRLPRDVSTIVLKALEKEPARRYASAAELGDDVRRWLTGHPIRARPASRLYALRKLVARNRWLSATVAALVLVILGGSLATGLAAQRAARERDRARHEADNAAALNRVLIDFFRGVNPWELGGSADVRVRDVLDSVARRCETEFTDPLLAASVRNTLGRMFGSFGSRYDYEASELHLRFALQTRLRVLGEHNADTAASMNDLGETLYRLQRWSEAEALFRDAVRVRREVLGRAHPATAESLNNLGLVLKERGQLGEAEQCYREALDLRRQARAATIADPHADPRSRVLAAGDLAQTMNNVGALFRARAEALGAAHDEAGRRAALEQARTEYLAALAIRREWLPENHPDVATTLNNLARCLADLADYDGAEQRFNEALAILRSGLEPEHQLIARALHNLAGVRLAKGDLDGAEAACAEALAMRRKLLGESSPETRESQARLEAIRAARPAR